MLWIWREYTINDKKIDVMWDDSPVDVSTEVNFIRSIANKLRGTYQINKYMLVEYDKNEKRLCFSS